MNIKVLQSNNAHVGHKYKHGESKIIIMAPQSEICFLDFNIKNI